MCVCACESVNAVLSLWLSLPVSLSPSLLSLPAHSPVSAAPVSLPVSVSSLALIVWLAALRECVCLKRPRLGHTSPEKRENRQGAGGVKSFGALTEAKGEEGRPATGKFRDN